MEYHKLMGLQNVVIFKNVVIFIEGKQQIGDRLRDIALPIVIPF